MMKDKLRQYALPLPFVADNVQYSVVASANDDNSHPSEFLLDVALNSAKIALNTDLSEVSMRMKSSPKWVDIYPGEHYKLLAGIMQYLKPKISVEIGTYHGLGSLTIYKHLPQASRLYTFDILDWTYFDKDTCLMQEDFSDGRMVQVIDDLSDLNVVNKHKEILENADFIFIDAAKDGLQEQLFLDNFYKLNIKKSCLVMFDDIRLWNMLSIWRNISKPKLDLTSFGHWSGTGLIEW
jgi:predicted O-methyltransferase YrrM